MNMFYSRRRFLAGSSITAAAMLLPEFSLRAAGQDPVVDAAGEAESGVTEQMPWRVEPFPLQNVKLLPGIFSEQMKINTEYLHSLDSDSLLHSFRVTAGIASQARPYGGWEAPDCELRGHFNGGHYLSACALTYATSGDRGLKEKADGLVAALAKCQAVHTNGYLSAFPEDFFDRLRKGEQVWAPFYTLHKIMAGLLDMYVYCGNVQAMSVVEDMAKWVGHWVEGMSDDLMARILKTEYGGTMESLCNLYALTGKREYLWTASRFEQEQFYGPLAAHRDELKGLHANTHVPKVIAAARRYELTGDDRYRQIAEYFYKEVTTERCYATGGTSNNEGWLSDPGRLDGQLSLTNSECCVSYNLMKLSRHIFGWTADPRCIDFYERTLFNMRLGTQDAHGLKMYYVPQAAGYWKFYHSATKSFWCCTGTGVEEFAKLGDTIYFHDADGIYVNLMIASEVEWKQKGMTLRQETRFPAEQGTTLTVRTARPVDTAIHLRVPYWAKQGGSVRLNGETLPVFSSPSSYLTLKRTWKDGDRIELAIPMSLHGEPLPGDETMQAAMYGPLVLAARLGSEGLTEALQYDTTGKENRCPGDPKAVSAPEVAASAVGVPSWVKPTSGALRFETEGASERRELVPFYQISGERYAIYWKVKQA